jgi:SAM-dependent methyltransferase
MARTSRPRPKRSTLSTTRARLLVDVATDDPRHLNLGCGSDVRPASEGWVNMDAIVHPGVVRHDATVTPWPFADGSFSHVFASHFFEHVPTPSAGERDALFAILEESARVLRDGGELEVLVPVAGSVADHANPTHYRHFHERAFTFFAWSEGGERYHDAPFRLVSVTRRRSAVPYRSAWVGELDARVRVRGVPLAEHLRIRAPRLFRLASAILATRSEYRVVLRKDESLAPRASVPSP